MPFDPSLSRLIQHLNFVVSVSEDALLGTDPDRANRDEDDGVPWVDDPSTCNGWALLMGPGVAGGGATGTPGPARDCLVAGYVKRVPPGGSGMRPSRRRPTPVYRVTVTADDESKTRGEVFTWDGDEFSDTGLL